MYTVKVWNLNESPTTIWDYRKSDNLMISGTLDKEIESVDQFDFELIDNSVKLKPFTSFVEVRNEKKGQTVFRGRIITPTSEMHEDGTYGTSYSAEGEMAYLDDTAPPYQMWTDWPAQKRLTQLLGLHNERSESYKQFYLDTSSITPKVPKSSTEEYDDTAYFITDPEKSILDNIREFILEPYGGEIYVDYSNSLPKFVWTNQIGTKKSTEIRIGKNMKSFQRQIDPTEVITRLIPLGSSEETAWGGSKRLEIVEDPRSGGKNYIDIPELISIYGIQTRAVVFDDEYTPDTLYDRAREEIVEIKKAYAKMTTEIALLDLYTIGLDPDEFERGNIHRTILPRFGIDEDLRIVGTSFDVTEPQNKTVRIGDKELSILDVSDYNTVNIIKNTVPGLIETSINNTVNTAVESEVNQQVTRMYGDAVADLVNENSIYIDNKKRELQSDYDAAVRAAEDRVKAIEPDYTAFINKNINDIAKKTLDNINSGYQGKISSSAINVEYGFVKNLAADQMFANDIKSLSMSAFEGNITKLRSEIITAGSITAEALKADNAMITKLTANDLMADKIAASSAIVNKIQSTSITTNQLTMKSVATELGKIPAALTIKRPDGYNVIINGETQFGLNLWRYFPQFIGVSTEIAPYNNYFRIKTPAGTDGVFDAFAFKHDSGYLVINLQAYISGSGSGSSYISVQGFGGTDIFDQASLSSTSPTSINFRIPLGTPNGQLKYFYLKADSWSNPYVYVREIIVYQED